MEAISVLTPYLLAAAATVGLTGLVRRYALAHEILDIPNHRSSHVRPTPRGGGLGFVAVFLIGAAVILYRSFPAKPGLPMALLGGIPIAVVGWIDDRKRLSVWTRLGVQVLSAMWAVGWLGGLPDLELGEGVLPLGFLAYPAGVLLVTWTTNFYNFMDGIDGLATVQGILGSAGLGFLLFLEGSHRAAHLYWLICATLAGFLVWNWPPARIFMGDVGSGFLGFTFAVLAIQTENRGHFPLGIWLMILGPFVVDATLTLVRRLLKRERFLEGHRTHAYQLAVQHGFSHRTVTLAWAAIDALMIGLSYVALDDRPHLVSIVGTSILSLILLWVTVLRRLL